MMQKPITPAEKTPAMRVVMITLDRHLAEPAARIEARLADEVPGLRIALHAAADWSERPDLLEQARADIAEADIVVATMLFIEEHVRAILPALEARREQCDAMVGAISAPEIVKLTRLGDLRMDRPAKGIVALLKRLRGKPKEGQQASSGAGQMKMLRRLPKILRFIPGKAQDLRAYFLTMQYYLSGSEDNLENLVRFLVDRYAAGPGRICAARSPPPTRSTIPRPASTTRRPGSRPTRRTCPRGRRRAARWGSCSCAPTFSPATPRITTR